MLATTACQTGRETAATPDETVRRAPAGLFAWYGKTKVAAKLAADGAGTAWRVAREDDQLFPLTKDFVDGRVTWEINNGIVVHAVTETLTGGRYEGCRTPKLRPYVGLAEAAAQQMASDEGVLFRLLSRDGERFAVTADYVPDRVNVEIRAGYVVHASNG